MKKTTTKKTSRPSKAKTLSRPYQCVKYDGIDPVDTYVGTRIRERRVLIGMAQTRLGEIAGPTFQQIQKYERGFNRVSASMLVKLSRALDVPVSYFFEGLDQPVHSQQDAIDSRAILELARNVALLPKHLQDNVHSLARTLADQFGRKAPGRAGK